MAAAVAVVDAVVRYLVLAAAGCAGLVALTHWAVRAGRLAAFGSIATTVRRLSDPVIRPLERTLVRSGRNPQDATFWLFGLVLVAGVATLSMSRWLTGLLLGLAALGGAGPRAWVQAATGILVDLMMLALRVRVIGSWFGAGRYGPLRPAWLVTDWLVEPIRRRLPAMGPVDISPIVAWFVLVVLRGILFTVL